MTTNIASAQWTDAEKRSIKVTHIDGSILFVPPDPGNSDYAALIAGNVTIADPPAPPPPVYSCALWQLQSVLTSAQWTSVQNWISAQNNAALSAFFAHGTNLIPSTSTTLQAIGSGALGLTAAQVTALVQQASAVAIP